MRMMKMVVFTVLMFVWICEGGVPSTLDVCSCASDGDTFDCRLVRGTRISASGCIGNLRTTGPGYVTDIENGLLDKFQRVIIERTTLNCDSVIGVRDDQYVVMDNVVCVGDSMTSTPTTTPRAQLTMEPRPRPPPPAQPVNDDDDDDDDDDDNSDSDADYSDSDADDDDNDDVETTTNKTVSTTTTTTTKMITIAAVTAFGDWLLVVGVGIIVTGAGVVVIIRMRAQRQRRRRQEQHQQSHQPIQVGDVSSTDDQPQRTYVLRSLPRSPRRRGVDSSCESVTLFAVDDSEL